MPPFTKQKTNPPLLRLLFSVLIGVIIGYLIFSKSESKLFLFHPSAKGTICLVIDDFGFAMNSDVEDFLQLNENITAAIIPGTPYAEQIGKYAQSIGVETIIHMPMESHEVDNTEYPISLNEKLNAALVEERIQYAFEEVPTALGMNNHQGSKATENLQLMKNIARTLKNLNKFFLDSFTNPESRGYITMRRYGVPTQLRQVFLDHVESPIQIKTNLDSLAALSHEMDIAVGIGHVKQITLEVLQKEIPRLESEGYRFIRLSQAVR
ncbi:MAG: divergent polysaccharide deacetylase family protein [Candidatus Marinimicrobia bacterium]|nr:divergent polysaccharide deacetylase family protein [Candidatus Neomarinimicrobiota bacterium]